WDGKADIEQFETDGPAGHIEGLTLRTYNPQSQQWSLYWANSKDGPSASLWLGSSRMGVASFTTRNPSRAGPFLFAMSGQKSPRIRPISNSHFPMMEARLGR